MLGGEYLVEETKEWLLRESPDDIKPFISLVYSMSSKRLASQMLLGLRQAKVDTRRQILGKTAVKRLARTPGRGKHCLELFEQARTRWLLNS